MIHANRSGFVIIRYRVGVTAIALFAALSLFYGCSRGKGDHLTSSRYFVVVGIEGDVDSFNPLFAEDVTAGELNDLFYPGLTTSSFNREKGMLEYRPLIARSWEFENGRRDLRLHLKPDARWSTGERITAHDVQTTYALYSDTAVASVRQPSMEGLLRSKDGTLHIGEAVEVVDDTTVVFHFERPYPGELFDASLPIVPSHVFGHIKRGASMREDSTNRHPISSGPFTMRNWEPLRQIELIPNENSTLPGPAKISDLIYRIIPDYRSRLMQLKSGEIDVFPYINPEDALRLQKDNVNLDVVPLGERFYDAINWNNLDPALYTESTGKKIAPHPLFGTALVRRALTMAINRKEIVDSYLKPYGREAIGPVSPIFRWAYNDALQPVPFDPQQARTLLREAGWRDTDGDGILDKNGKRFSFVLKIPSGSDLRATLAAVVQHQLRAVGVDVQIEQFDRAAFWGDLMARKFDAAIAGFSVPLQMQLDELWGADLEKARFNLSGFRNNRVEEILTGARRVENESDHAEAWKEFQAILHEEQPCTFLYWMNDLVAVNKRLKGTDMGVLGVSYHAGSWYVDDGAQGGRTMR